MMDAILYLFEELQISQWTKLGEVRLVNTTGSTIETTEGLEAH